MANLQKKNTKKIKKHILVILISAVLFLLVFLRRYNYIISDNPILIAACDGFCAIGVLNTLIGFIALASSKGLLDGLFYITRNVSFLFKHESQFNYMSFYDFQHTRKRYPASCKLFFSYGVIFFVLCFLMFLIAC